MTVNSLKAIVEKIENNKQISFGAVFLLIYIASFLRGFLENYANFDNENRIMGVIDTFFHYPFWFFGIFISVFILLALFTKERIEKVSRLGGIFSLIIVLPPILDLIIRGGMQTRYSFIVGTFSDLFQSFFTFLGGVTGGTYGATTGMKIEIALAILAAGFYIFHKTKKFFRAIAGALVLYAIIFIFISSPTFIFAAKNAFSADRQEITYQTINDFYSRQELAASFTKNKTFIVENSNNALSAAQGVNNVYSATLSVIFLILDVLLLGWWFWLYGAKKFIATVKNFRFLRITHYFLMASVGIYFGIKFSGHGPINSLFDFASFVSLFMCLLFSWLFSVWENDEIDIEIDKISNSDRPLIENTLTIEEWRVLKYLFFFIALSFAFLGGLYLFIFALLFLSLYHIYSIPPLRLKRFFGVSSLVIACNALIAVLMGFFMFSGTENLQKFPSKYFLGILIIFFLAEHIKNLKDFEGDKRDNIQNLPVVLGLKNGKLATGILVFFAVLLVPIFFYFNVITFFTAVFFGLALFFTVNAEKFKEKYIFVIYFIFIAVFIGETAMFSSADSFNARANRAATAGWQWLYQYNNNFSDPGIPLIIKTINDKYCHSPKAEIFWKNILKEFENHSYLPVFERFFFDEADYKNIGDKALTILKTPQVYYNDVLPQALYCDLYPVRENFAAKAFDKIETETGYDLTHKFWSAVLFKENGCIAEGYNIDEIILAAARKMAAIQEASEEFNDLYAERTAFLEYYGFKSLVKEDWIKNIMDNQLESGAWSNSVKGVGNPHTTALSVWTLAEYSAICPFQ
ncbi:MAG: UbiA family prenyltransferase [Spirochaetota bacterium]